MNDVPSDDILKLIEQYNEIELKIIKKLNKLPRNGCPCECNISSRYGFKQIFEWGNHDEIEETCATCGGYIER